jgi:hypothetical protein
MSSKKIFKIPVLLIIILVVFYLVYCISGIYKINAWQNKIGETLPDTFRIELPLIKNQDNYFCVGATINGNYNADFILDTKASPLVKIETINDLNAGYWGRYPVPVWNSYGQKEKFPLYHFKSFKIQSLTFNNPLFKGISKSNAMYDLMGNGVVGKEIIKQLYWKFALDDKKMILFSNKDSLLLCKETENYIKIENGLVDNNIFLPDISTYNHFMFDSGYAGEIMVNKKIFTHLSNRFSPKKFISTRRTATKNDTTYVFERMNIEWNGIKIPDCLLVYSPITNKNIIGVELANRFNFVLASNNLYLQPRKDFQHFESASYCSGFGFDIGKSENGFIIKRIEIGGIADKAGIRVKDKIVHIDYGNFDLNDVNQLNSYLKDKKSVIVGIEKEGENTVIQHIIL